VALGMKGAAGVSVNDLAECLDEIEQQLDAGEYRPGPWAAFLRAARQEDRAGRRSLSDDVSRVGDKIHRRNHPATLPLWIGLSLELVAVVAGVLMVDVGLRRALPGMVLVAAAILALAVQPLLKVAVGYVVGIRYSYVYVSGVEPRVKMRYGTYLASARWRRVVVHLSGTVGSPLALCWVALAARSDLPDTAAICWVLFWILVAVQVVLFLVVLAGARRSGPLGMAHSSSGGSAARELRTPTGP
jgi:hypothetical protein